MTWVIMVPALLVGAFLQMELPGFAWLGQAKFPFLLAVVLYYALSRGPGTMLVAAFVGGLLQDTLSPIPMGYSVVCFAAVGWLAGRFRATVLVESALTPLFFGLLAAAAVPLGLYGLLVREDLVVWPPGRLLLRVVGSGVLGAFTTLAVFEGIRRLDRLVGLVEVVEEFDGLE